MPTDQTPAAPVKRPRPKNMKRRWLRWLVVVAIVLLVLVALAPSLLSWGLGRGLIENAINDHVRGEVSIDQLSLRWFGGQSIQGLRLEGEDRQTVINVNASTDRGLLGLIFEPTNLGTVTASGALEAVRRADGTTSIDTLFITDPNAPPLRLPRSLEGQVTLAGVQMSIEDEVTRETVALRDFGGSIVLDLDGANAFDLRGVTDVGGTPGELALKGEVSDLLAPDGSLALATAHAALDAAITNFPMVLVDALAGQDNRLASLTGPTMTEANLQLEGDMDDGRLTFDVQTTRLTAEGAVTARNGRAMIEEDAPVIVTGTLTDEAFHAWVQAEPAETAGADATSANGGTAAPAPTMVADQPASLLFRITRADVPLPDSGGVNLDDAAFTSTLEVTDLAFDVPIADATQRLAVPRLHWTVQSEDAARSISLQGGARIDEATIDFDQTIEHLADSTGALALENAVARGTVNLSGITRDVAALFIPDHAQTFAELTQGPLQFQLSNEPVADGKTGDVHATITLESPNLNGTVPLLKRGDALAIEGGTLHASIPESLIVSLQPAAAEPIRAHAGEVTITLEPSTIFTFAPSDGGEQETEAASVVALVASPAIVIDNAPALTGPASLRQLELRVSIPLGGGGRDEAAPGAAGTATVYDEAQGAAVASLDLTLSPQAAEPDEGDSAPAPLHATMALEDVDVGGVATMLGRSPDTVVAWIGERGSVKIDANIHGSDMTATLTPTFPTLTGSMLAVRTKDGLLVQSTGLTLTMSAAQLEPFLNRASDPAGTETTGRNTLAADVPVSLSIAQCTIPANLLAGESFDPALVRVDASVVAAQPIEFRHTNAATGESSTQVIPSLHLSLRSEHLGRGVDIILTDDGVVNNDSLFGVVANVRRLVDDEGRLDPSRAAVDLEAVLSEVPTWLADALGGRAGLVGKALGESFSGTLTTRQLTSESGRIDATLQSANDSHLTTALAAREGGLRTLPQPPTVMALTLSEALRDHLLSRLHLIFSDIRAMEEQVRVSVSDAFLPWGDDLSKLNARILVEVGEVELDSASQFLRVLEFVRTSDSRETIPALIGDLHVSIRNGVLMYDDFIVQIARADDGSYEHSIAFSGNIDLATRHVNAIVGTYPVADLRHAFEEFRAVPEGVSVGLKFSGDLYDAQGNPQDLQVEPVLDVELEDVIREQLKDRVPELDDLLPDIFGGGKRRR